MPTVFYRSSLSTSISAAFRVQKGCPLAWDGRGSSSPMAGTMAHWQSDLIHPPCKDPEKKQMGDWEEGAVAIDILTKKYDCT